MISSAMRLLTAVQAALADSVVLISTAAIWETFSEISSEIFFGGGRSRGGRSNGPMRGADVRTSVRITFEEAIFGCEKELELNLKETCEKCHGTGAKPGTQPQTCPKCNGKGKIMYTQQSFFGQIQNVQTCPDCNGTGKIIRINARIATEPAM